MLGNEQLTIIGHIGQDAEIKETNGNRFVRFSVGVNKGYKDRNGNWVDRTNWWSVIIRNENLAKHLTKGKYIMVQGEPRPGTFKNQHGDYMAALNLNGDSVHFLVQPRNDQNQQTHSPRPTQTEQYNSGPVRDNTTHDLTGSQMEEEELPF